MEEGSTRMAHSRACSCETISVAPPAEPSVATSRVVVVTDASVETVDAAPDAPTACIAARPTRCEVHNFGRRGLRTDVTTVRRAHVLVGTHGAALIHALFMPPRSAFVEIRPYHFDGAWPDAYHYAMAQRENATHAFVVRTVNRSLCSPEPPANVSAWDARPLNTHVRAHVFLRALDAAACSRGQGDPLHEDGGVTHAIRTEGELPQLPRARFDYNALTSPVILNV